MTDSNYVSTKEILDDKRLMSFYEGNKAFAKGWIDMGSYIAETLEMEPEQQHDRFVELFILINAINKHRPDSEECWKTLFQLTYEKLKSLGFDMATIKNISEDEYNRNKKERIRNEVKNTPASMG